MGIAVDPGAIGAAPRVLRGSRRTAGFSPGTIDTILAYDADPEKRREWPDAEDRGNAENLSALPWLRYPTDRATCEAIVARCDAIVQRGRTTPRAKAFFASLREHIAALADRFARQA
jgi:hypothetical protein